MSSANPDPSRRRAFFREAFARAIEPVANLLDAGADDRHPPTRLRPPGALDEDAFLSACARCGACVEICPADAIFPLGSDVGSASGTPVIDPDRAACVVCDGLVCTTACPSGALQPLVDAMAIRMGLAEVYESLCVRTHGESCSRCVDDCPLGAEAILFTGSGPPTVFSGGCVGCGVCQYNCPTQPKAIVVRPY